MKLSLSKYKIKWVDQVIKHWTDEGLIDYETQKNLETQ
jgi:hypothetical protein